MNDRVIKWWSVGFVLLFATGLAHAQQSKTAPQLLSLSAEISASKLSSWLSHQVPEQFVGQGNKKVCQRFLGLKACGKAQWDYQVHRMAAIRLLEPSAASSDITLAVPLKVGGTVGIDGDVGKLLGLDSVPIAAELNLIVKALVNGTAKGCPVVQANASPQWVTTPTATLAGNFDIDLSEILEKALEKQVVRWQQTLNEILHCDSILAQLEPLWATCYIDASRADSGPAIWAIQTNQLHWSVQNARPNKNLGLVVGFDTNVNLQLGVPADEVAKRLQFSNCATQWEKVLKPIRGNANRSDQNSVARVRLIFDPALQSNSSQAVTIDVNHQAMSRYAQSQLANRDLGQDDGGSTVVLKTVTLQPGDNKAGNAIQLETEFDAIVRSGEGVIGWIQNKVGLGEKALHGVMTVQATPVWNSDARSLSFKQLTTEVTEIDPGSPYSITHAAFAFMERHVQKSLSKQSTVPFGEALDSLSVKINQAVDEKIIEQSSILGAQWRPNTAVLSVQDVATLGDGMTLRAQLDANWLLTF